MGFVHAKLLLVAPLLWIFFTLLTTGFGAHFATKPPAFPRPNLIICNAAISACERGSQWEMASFLLRQMAGQRQIPDLISYSALVTR